MSSVVILYGVGFDFHGSYCRTFDDAQDTLERICTRAGIQFYQPYSVGCFEPMTLAIGLPCCAEAELFEPMTLSNDLGGIYRELVDRVVADLPEWIRPYMIQKTPTFLVYAYNDD